MPHFAKSPNLACKRLRPTSPAVSVRNILGPIRRLRKPLVTAAAAIENDQIRPEREPEDTNQVPARPASPAPHHPVADFDISGLASLFQSAVSGCRTKGC